MSSPASGAPRRPPRTWARLAQHVLQSAPPATHEALLSACGVEPASLQDPEGFIPTTAYLELVERTGGASEPLAWAARLCSSRRPESFDALGFLVLTSPTLRQGLERLAHYQRVWFEGERYHLAERAAEALISYHPELPRRPAHEALAALGLAEVLRQGSAVTGRPLPVRVLCLRQPAPRSPESLARYLEATATHVPLEFHAEADELVLEREALDYPIASANAALFAFVDRQVARWVQQIPPRHESTRESAARQVAERLHEGVPPLGTVASALHLSERTLQRRLEDEGTSYTQLVESVRRERAEALLRAGAALAEVSYLLGYTEPSVLHRAVRRWAGLTPEQWRALLQQQR